MGQSEFGQEVIRATKEFVDERAVPAAQVIYDETLRSLRRVPYSCNVDPTDDGFVIVVVDPTLPTIPRRVGSEEEEEQ